MEFAEPSPSTMYAAALPVGRMRPRPRLSDVSAVVLQVDATVTRIHGLAWLTAQRDSATLGRLAELRLEGMANGWSSADHIRARIACLRPRRAEINALGRAYLDAMATDVIDVAHRLRRAGIAVELSGEVAVEALFGVADALGVTPHEIHAPRLRFDALGAFSGCEVPSRPFGVGQGGGPTPGRSRRVFVGTSQPEPHLDQERDPFVRYTGFVAHEGVTTGETVASFTELEALVTG
jgi:hypothetical protein